MENKKFYRYRMVNPVWFSSATMLGIFSVILVIGDGLDKQLPSIIGGGVGVIIGLLLRHKSIRKSYLLLTEEGLEQKVQKKKIVLPWEKIQSVSVMKSGKITNVICASASHEIRFGCNLKETAPSDTSWHWNDRFIGNIDSEDGKSLIDFLKMKLPDITWSEDVRKGSYLVFNIICGLFFIVFLSLLYKYKQTNNILYSSCSMAFGSAFFIYLGAMSIWSNTFKQLNYAVSRKMIVGSGVIMLIFGIISGILSIVLCTVWFLRYY
ncbi:MAG: hypothetical protein D3914_04645 [Candidatus Electrothrix sp. LOE2]|nr:hypothetical protein [Candidatus Electrothrix sp. LOE2]